MARTTWDRRFFSTTRGRILILLRKSSRTVDELASTLAVSDNAIRSHLYALERDGFVTHEGVRRGIGKPAWLYALAPAAERLFPKPYAPVLDTLLQVLSEQLPREEIDAALVEVGQRIAGTLPPLSGSVEERMPAVFDALANMGGLAELDDCGECLVIQGYDCPLSTTVKGYPDSCRVLQSLLESVLDRPVIEQCDRGDPPRCRFAIRRDDRGSHLE